MITLATDTIYKTRADAETGMRAIKVCTGQKKVGTFGGRTSFGLSECPLSTIRRQGHWRSGIGRRARHRRCLGCGERISARRGRHLVLDVPLDRLRFCNVLSHLFLLGSELLLRGGKLLLLGSELLYAAPQDGDLVPWPQAAAPIQKMLRARWPLVQFE